jgi:hypothetical protein
MTLTLWVVSLKMERRGSMGDCVYSFNSFIECTFL